VHYTAPPRKIAGVEVVIDYHSRFLTRQGYSVRLVFGKGGGANYENVEECEVPLLSPENSRVQSVQKEILEKLGLSSEERGNPIKAGILCGISFALSALVPIFPFIFPISSLEGMIISVIATIIALFGVGTIKTIFSRKNWIRSGLQMMIIGASAAGITYIIGLLFSLIF